MAATMRYSRNYLVVINHEPSRARFIKRGGYIEGYIRAPQTHIEGRTDLNEQVLRNLLVGRAL
jgi:hypothetical protein